MNKFLAALVAPRRRRRKPQLPDHAGIVAYRKARSTGTHVGLYRAAEAGIESDPNTPWAVVCAEHGGVVCLTSRKQGEACIAHPEEWCPRCQEAAGGPPAYPYGDPPTKSTRAP